jgi:hypothetical protein
MQAKMKCSNCGAEVSNLSITTNWKHLLFIVPIMLLGFWPLLSMMFNKGDITKDLAISDVQKRSNQGSLEIVGLLTNSGSHTWTSITVEAEFFDAAGNFIDESTQYLQSDVAGNAKEHFKITISNPAPALSAPDTKMVVKVSGGHTSRF